MPATILVPRYRRRDRTIRSVLDLRPTTLHILDSLGYVRDIAGGRWDATYTGSPTLAYPPLPTLPRGVAFSGSGQYATTSGSVPTPTASVSVLAVFATTDASAANRYPIGRLAASQVTWGLALGSTHLARFGAFQSTGTSHCIATGGAALNDGLPHLMVGSFDGTTGRVGADAANASTSTSLTGSWHKASTAGISIAALGTTGLFPGTVYLAAYWADRVITDAERLMVNAYMRGG